MLKSFDTVLKIIRDADVQALMQHRFVRFSGAGLAAVAFVMLGAMATGVLPGFSSSSASPISAAHASPQLQAMQDKVRARADIRRAGGRLAAPVAVLPAVTSAMSDNAFYAVIESAVQVAGEDHLAKRFAKLSAKQLDRERMCLAQAIYFEARSEGAQGKLAVAEVVLTRVADKRYPGTICGVVFQGSHLSTGCQFSWTCDGLKDVPANTAAWKKSQSLASYVMLDVQWEEVTGKATHYHADYVSPYWAPSLDEVATVGKHIFYRWTNRNGLRDS